MALESYLRYDKDLTRIALGYQTEFDPAVLKIAPFVPVPDSTEYPSFSKGAFDESNVEDLRAMFSPDVPELKYDSVTWTPIVLPEYALKILAVDRKAKRSGHVKGLIATSPTEGAKLLKRVMYKKLQSRIIQATINSIDSSHKATPTNKWDTSTGDPMADLKTAVKNFRDNCGVNPSHILIPDDVLLYLGNKIRSYFGVTTEVDNMKLVQMAMLELGIPQTNIVIGTGRSYSASSSKYTTIYGDNVLLWYSPPKVEKWTPCFAKTFRAEDLPEIAVLPPYDAPDKTGQFVQAVMSYYPVITMQDAGYLIYDVLS